jgi:hypothetical protein
VLLPALFLLLLNHLIQHAIQIEVVLKAAANCGCCSGAAATHAGLGAVIGMGLGGLRPSCHRQLLLFCVHEGVEGAQGLGGMAVPCQRENLLIG